MSIKSFELRELFHLVLLRHLGARLSGRSYAVKGGICLRFFHRSARLSEDMDIDVASNVRVETLKKAVDSIMNGRALLAALMPAGVTRLTATKPKQTLTTQRWKINLYLSGGGSLPTKLEFSRRQDKIDCSSGVPDAELLRRHKLPPFAARFYDAPAMAAQKIAALAAPPRHALRDLFDLHHLFFTLSVKPGQLLELIAPASVEAAAEKISGFTFQDFKEQVLPYLSDEMIDLYQDATLFARQKEAVTQALSAIKK